MAAVTHMVSTSGAEQGVEELGHIGCANPTRRRAANPGLGPTRSRSHFWDPFHDISRSLTSVSITRQES